MRRVGIIGAGLSGLVCGQQLQQAGWEVIILDKGRGPAGRISTRRVSEPELQFDHGGQYYTARDPRFVSQVQDWIARGVAAAWEGPFVSLDQGQVSEPPGNDERYVGTPSMSAIAKDLAQGMDVRCSCLVKELIRKSSSWEIHYEVLGTDPSESGMIEVDEVVLTIPPAQAINLLPEESRLKHCCESVELDPCRCVMVGFENRVGVDFGAAFVQNSPLRWIARENSKPGRNNSLDSWVLHASPEWSNTYVDAPAKEVEPLLMDAFRATLGVDLPSVGYLASHRWLYAIPRNPFADGCHRDEDRHITLSGDWCHDARIEGAYLSGLATAARLLEST